MEEKSKCRYLENDRLHLEIVWSFVKIEDQMIINELFDKLENHMFLIPENKDITWISSSAKWEAHVHWLFLK